MKTAGLAHARRVVGGWKRGGKMKKVIGEEKRGSSVGRGRRAVVKGEGDGKIEEGER